MKKRLNREESQHATREKLLNAATELIVARGIHTNSISTIAEAAGFSKGAFFSNFSTKNELLLEVMQRFKLREISDLKQVLDDNPSDETLSQALAQYISNLKNNSDCAIMDVELQLLALRDKQFSQAYQLLHYENANIFGDLIAIIFRHAGKDVPQPAEQLATMFIALIEGLILQQHKDPGSQVALVLNALIQSAPQKSSA
ncbi:TetR/AcrR family transcriptional regulator [Klebsiella michiganensis]|nr:TetR/AcrR family transcriptional regulator [Klebsiella michiganensis]HBU6430628.1 TetR/AcrR family transcriptional regulator [Klebsiella oxytoca]